MKSIIAIRDNFKQGTRVKFNIYGIIAEGKIVGISTIGYALIGKMYIIEPDIELNSEKYEYSHFCLWSSQFEVID